MSTSVRCRCPIYGQNVRWQVIEEYECQLGKFGDIYNRNPAEESAVPSIHQPDLIEASRYANDSVGLGGNGRTRGHLRQ